MCWEVIGDPSGVEESSSCQAQQVIGEALKVCVCVLGGDRDPSGVEESSSCQAQQVIGEALKVCVCVLGGDGRPLWCGGVFFLSGTAGHR